VALRSKSPGSMRGVPQCCCIDLPGRVPVGPPSPSIPPPPVAAAPRYQFSHVLVEGGSKLLVGDTPTSPARGWPPPGPPLCSFLCNTTGGVPWRPSYPCILGLAANCCASPNLWLRRRVGPLSVASPHTLAVSLAGSGVPALGHPADLVLMDTTAAHWIPRHDLAAGVVYTGHPGDVAYVWANGRLLYRRGEYLTVDVERIRWEAKRRALRSGLFRAQPRS